MNNLLIISGNTKEEKDWILSINKKLSLENNVFLMIINNPTTFQKEINKVKSIFNSSSQVFIISTVFALPFVTYLINDNILNIKLYLCLAKGPPENYELTIKKICVKSKLILFYFNNYNLENSIHSTPSISIRGGINDLDEYIDYIKFSLLIHCDDTKYELVSSNEMKSALLKIDKERLKYKYINNWLFDPDNKLLSFLFKDNKYIAKRITMQKAKLEIFNSKILKKILNGIMIDKFKINIIVPTFFSINHEYGYLVSRFYGKDLNQIYYEKGGGNLNFLNDIYVKIQNLLEANHLNYNGFLPRNIILDNNNIYLIDFEDINKKSKLVTVTTQNIAWSYFIDLDVEKIADLLGNEYNINLSSDMKRIVSCYPNIYKLALIAESSYNSYRKLDDIINVLSEYLNYEVELILDIILYEQSVNNISTDIEELLYSLCEKIKLIAPFCEKKCIEKIVNFEINNILIYLQDKISSSQLNDAIIYAKRKINN